MKMPYYQVRFVCYQYNCGGSMTNGNQLCRVNLPDLPAARLLAEKVKGFARRHNSEIPEGSGEFARDYVHDGFVEKFVGIFKITEEEVQ